MPTFRSVTKAWRNRLVKQALAKALGQACDQLAHRVVINAPVESGELKESVESTPVVIEPQRISASVVVTSDHALPVEYGTENMLPQPYFRPAIATELAAMKAIVRKSIR